MIKFKPFRHFGNIIPVNHLLKAMADEINALRAELDELKKQAPKKRGRPAKTEEPLELEG